MAKIALLFVLTSICFLVTQKIMKMNESDLEMTKHMTDTKEVARKDVTGEDEVDNTANHTASDKNDKYDYMFMYDKAPISLMEKIINDFNREHEEYLIAKTRNEQINKDDMAGNENNKNNNNDDERMKRDTSGNPILEDCEDNKTKRSCTGRCNMKQNIDLNKFYCQCDTDCEKYGDCCKDVHICDNKEVGPTETTEESSGENIESSGENIESNGENIESSGEKIESSGENIESSRENIESSGENIESSGENIESSGEYIVSKGENIESSGEYIKSSGEYIESSGENIESSRENIGSSGETIEFNGENIEFNGENIESNGENIESSGESIESSGENIESNAENIESGGENIESSGENIESSGEYIESSRENIESSGEYIESSGENIESSGENIESSGEYIKSSGEYIESSGEYIESSGENIESSRENIDTPYLPQKKEKKMEEIPQSADKYSCIETEKGTSYFLYQSCDPTYTNTKTILQCLATPHPDNTNKHSLLITPVYGKKQQHYRNMYCALCNNEIQTDLKFWSSEVVCGNLMKDRIRTSYEKHAINIESIFRLFSEDGCTHHYKLTETEKYISGPRECMETLDCDFCPVCKDKGFDPMKSNKGIFYNTYCAKASGFDGKLGCNISSTDLFDPLTDYFLSKKVFSFTVLADFSQGDPFHPSIKIKGGQNIYGMADSSFSCFATSVIIPLFCETKKCPVNFEVVNKECLPVRPTSSITVFITVNGTKIKPSNTSSYVTNDPETVKLARFHEVASNAISSAFPIVGFIEHQFTASTPPDISSYFYFQVFNTKPNKTGLNGLKVEQKAIEEIIYEGVNIKPNVVIWFDERDILDPVNGFGKVIDGVENVTESYDDVVWSNSNVSNKYVNSFVVNASGFMRTEMMTVSSLPIMLMTLWFCLS
ncbi:unnamed protein product [Owenia fusiformis]|uniref:SMB domain-containing protein n=1 Tax=Owenia fusiformis TaxID=6347 RepID=A0A8S4NXD8_OWEFU|nr:unnamed protein product [Owenia fusiformis]